LSVFSDFDLEAQIKTLPACSLEKVVRPKRNVGKSSLSESDSWNNLKNVTFYFSITKNALVWWQEPIINNRKSDKK
jgi:hypothetical protein